jgi:hypothetical protein
MKLIKIFLSQWTRTMIFAWLMCTPGAVYAQSTSFNAQQPYILSLDSTLTNVLYFPNPLRTYLTNVTLTAATSLTIYFSPPFADTNYIVTAPNGLVGSTVSARTTTNFTLGFTSATLTSQTIEGSCIHQWIFQADTPVTVVTNPTVLIVTNTSMELAAITTAPVSRSLRNDSGEWDGWIANATSNLHITQVGRWVIGGTTLAHTNYIYSTTSSSSPATLTLLGSAVTPAGSPTNQYVYTTLATPIAVSSGTTIVVLGEHGSSEPWYDLESYTWTADWDASTMGAAVSYDNGTTCLYFGGGHNDSYVPVNIEYTVP